MKPSKPNLSDLSETITTLRSPAGCPWDQKQTDRSLVNYLKSEFNELLEAIEKGDSENICEELGDMLYLIMMVSEIHKEQVHFNFQDVIDTVNQKLIRRHPHVFDGGPQLSDEELREQWERIKSEEKRLK